MERIGEGIVRSDAYLKTLFENGDKPTEDDFADLIESKAHKKEVFLREDEVTNEDIDLLLEGLFSNSNDGTKTFVVVEPKKEATKETNLKDNKDVVKTKASNNTQNNNNQMMKAVKKPSTNNGFKNPKDNGFKKYTNNKFGNSGTKKIRARIKK